MKDKKIKMVNIFSLFFLNKYKKSINKIGISNQKIVLNQKYKLNKNNIILKYNLDSNINYIFINFMFFYFFVSKKISRVYRIKKYRKKNSKIEFLNEKKIKIFQKKLKKSKNKKEKKKYYKILTKYYNTKIIEKDLRFMNKYKYKRFSINDFLYSSNFSFFFNYIKNLNNNDWGLFISFFILYKIIPFNFLKKYNVFFKFFFFRNIDNLKKYYLYVKYSKEEIYKNKEQKNIFFINYDLAKSYFKNKLSLNFSKSILRNIKIEKNLNFSFNQYLLKNKKYKDDFDNLEKIIDFNIYVKKTKRNLFITAYSNKLKKILKKHSIGTCYTYTEVTNKKQLYFYKEHLLVKKIINESIYKYKDNVKILINLYFLGNNRHFKRLFFKFLNEVNNLKKKETEIYNVYFLNKKYHNGCRGKKLRRK